MFQFSVVVIYDNQYDKFLFCNCTKNSTHCKIMEPALLRGPAGSPCTGLIKSNRPLYVLVSHKLSIRSSDLWFIRCISHVTNVLLMEFQIRSMSHIATMSMWTDPSFAVQIQACQLGVEPRYFAGRVIYVGHVSSIQLLLQRTTHVYKK